MKKHIPNTITTIRLILAIVFPFAFLYNPNIGTAIFIIASLSDSIDGFLARRWNVVSKYGRTIDPIADKILVATALIIATIYINKYLILPLLLEAIISIVNIFIYNKNRIFYVIKCGKIKAIFLYPLIVIGLLTYTNSNIMAIFYPLLLITVLLQMITIAMYILNSNNNNNNNIKKG